MRVKGLRTVIRSFSRGMKRDRENAAVDSGGMA